MIVFELYFSMLVLELYILHLEL